MTAYDDHQLWTKKQRTYYDKIVETFSSRMDKFDPAKQKQQRKGERPLKMPKDYDFSVKNVNWGDYSRDFILRTDACWEKSKLYDVFYTMYKREIFYEPIN